MSLNLKYRPKDFLTMVGQVFIRETLSEAVKNQKLVGAYLFCGPRGTGKTSTARILAKSINCSNPIDGNPCHNCLLCKAFSENKLIDIIEIDAASYTGVDNIRDIIEKAQFMPNIAKYKVYIIDEVHMLTTGAFNALLKILEEPPLHVKFILATTEIHKIPETILSRCQRFDFKSITIDDIKGRLKYIAGLENIKIDEKSLDYISKNSTGGLRNAITLFEQLVINSEIKFENIIKNLGITELDELSLFLIKLINGDISVVSDFENISNTGKNIKLFFKDLLYYIRDEIIDGIKAGKNIGDLNEILIILDETYSKTKNSLDEKITFLSGIIKVVKRGDIQNIILSNEQKTKPNQIVNNIPKLEIKENIVTNFTPKDLSVEISHDDVIDIFGETEKQTISEKLNTSFKKDDLILKVKELGGRGSLTMGLRSGNVGFDGEILYIKTPSKIALGAFQETGGKEIILDAMNKLGFSNISLKIE